MVYGFSLGRLVFCMLRKGQAPTPPVRNVMDEHCSGLKLALRRSGHRCILQRGSFGMAIGIPLSSKFTHMGGCQNYGPFLGPYYNTAPII